MLTQRNPHKHIHTTAAVEPVAQVAQAARPSNAPSSAGSRVNKDAESLLRCAGAKYSNLIDLSGQV